MKSLVHSALSVALAVGILSACSSNDAVPGIPPSGPTASADDQQTPQSDALTSQEAALVSEGNSEPNPATAPDL